MPIVKTSPQNKRDRVNCSFNMLAEEYLEFQQVFIRRKFDAAILDTEAIACIRLASEMGFSELAAEMVKDYNSEVSHD